MCSRICGPKAKLLPKALPGGNLICSDDDAERAWWYPDICSKKNPYKVHEVLSFRSLWNDDPLHCRDWTFEQGYDRSVPRRRNEEIESLAPNEVEKGLFVDSFAAPLSAQKKQSSRRCALKGMLCGKFSGNAASLEEKRPSMREKFKRFFEQPVLA